MRGRVPRSSWGPSLWLFLALAGMSGLPAPGGMGRFGWAPPTLAAQENDASAGTVVGRITEAGTGTPQIGAFVALLDESDERRAAVLTDESGRYVLRVLEPGRYRLRVEGLGVASTFGDFFDFARGEVREENLTLRAAALNIEGLEVTGDAQCDLGDADGSATVRLWDEARKALEVAQWVDEVGYVYDVTNFERTLDARAEEVFQEQRARRTLVGQSPFTSIDAETLMTEGFVIPDEAGVTYYGPDAAVLLSDRFLAAHCFEAVRDDDRVGLAFRPREGVRVPDIEGTLWFMEEGVMDRLEYRYTGMETYEDSEALGGDIHFRRLPQGAWIVQEWAIRMPMMTMVSPGGGTPRLTRIRETGAVVRSAQRMARPDAVYDDAAGAVRGRVAVSGEPGPRAARIYLSGTSHATLAASDGTFLLEGVAPGTYSLVIDHPSLRGMAVLPRTLSVTVPADSLVSVDVALPDREEVLAQRCESTEMVELDVPHTREAPLEAVGGVVRTASGYPVADRPVRVWWRYWRWADRGGSNRSGGRDGRTYSGAREGWSGTVLRTDALGGWVVCGVPERQIIYVDVPRLGLSEAEIEAGAGLGTEIAIDPLPSGAMWWVDLVVPDPELPSSGARGR